MDRHPYIFRSDPTNPPSLYSMSAVKVLARYNTKELLVTKQKFQKLDSKASFERAKRQLTKYFGLLNDLIKSDLLEMLFNYKWDSYRQKHRSILDKEMLDNNLCCTYPEECSGTHNLDLQVSSLEYIMMWKILSGKNSTNLNMLHFLDYYQHMYGTPAETTKLNLIRDIEADLVKNTKDLCSVQQVQFFGNYRGTNAVAWEILLKSMPKLQSLEFHFWAGEPFFDIISENCSNLRELILYKQRQGRCSKDLIKIPSLVTKMADTLRVLIIDSPDINFSEKSAKELHKSVSSCQNLELLKLEAEESPILYFHNARYKIQTKILLITIRRSYEYIKIIRNLHRCFNLDVEIHLTFDTYVHIDNHKHAFFSQGPVIGGGENTVAQSTRDFEEREINYHQMLSEFGKNVTKLFCETDIRPEYFARLFPNIETLEMFSRATRKVLIDPIVCDDKTKIWNKLTSFSIEVDPGFTSACNEFYLVHILSDLFRYAKNIKAVKILASQTGLKVAEFSLMLELNKVKENVRKLEEVVFLSPYKMHGQGITQQLAMWFLNNCPNLRLLRDVSSWGGNEREWDKVIREAEMRGLVVGWSEKTRKDSLYTIDYDSEGWLQCDTGHKYELFNNLNDDWEVVDVEENFDEDVNNDNANVVMQN